MIPRHQPGYGFMDLGAFTAKGGEASITSVEAALASATGVPHAVLFPSMRAGLKCALELFAAREGNARTVVVPAYVCGVVHEAIHRAGWIPEFVDAPENSFLMDLTGVPVGEKVVVLSELFGHALAWPSGVPPGRRIYDWAMCVPHASHGERLQGEDIGFFSFGLGKPLFVGWGGGAVTHSAEIAGQLRLLRDALQRPTSSGYFDRTPFLLAQWAAFRPWVYGTLRRWVDRRARAAARNLNERLFSVPLGWDQPPSGGEPWQRPCSRIELFCAERVLDRAHKDHVARKRQEAIYRDQLEGLGPHLPPPGAAALSHFTLRVPAEWREELRKGLKRDGIDAGTLFGFPSHLSERHFPWALARSREVLNLPLGMALKDAQVVCIAQALTRHWHILVRTEAC